MIRCHGSEWAIASMAKLSAVAAVPITSGTFEPTRPASVPASGPATSITTAGGSSRKRPAPVTSAPKP